MRPNHGFSKEAEVEEKRTVKMTVEVEMKPGETGLGAKLRVRDVLSEGLVSAIIDKRSDSYDLVNPQDKYGRLWPLLAPRERCFKCGQPDNCGDCNCNPLSVEQVLELDGELAKGELS